MCIIRQTNKKKSQDFHSKIFLFSPLLLCICSSSLIGESIFTIRENRKKNRFVYTPSNRPTNTLQNYIQITDKHKCFEYVPSHSSESHIQRPFMSKCSHESMCTLQINLVNGFAVHLFVCANDSKPSSLLMFCI